MAYGLKASSCHPLTANFYQDQNNELSQLLQKNIEGRFVPKGSKANLK